MKNSKKPATGKEKKRIAEEKSRKDYEERKKKKEDDRATESSSIMKSFFSLFKRRRRSELDVLTASERIENKEKFKFNVIAFYLRLLNDYMSKGMSDSARPQKNELADRKFFYSSNRIFTTRGVKKLYFLYDLPMVMERGFVDDIRMIVDDAVDDYNTHNRTEYKVAVNLMVDAKLFDFDYTKRRVQGMWKQLTRQYEKLESARQDRTLEDELQSDKYTDAVRRKVNSYLYMKEAKDKRKSAFYKTTTVLEVACYGNPQVVDEVLLYVEKRINEFCFSENVSSKTLFLQAHEYQSTYSPMVSPAKKSILKNMYPGDVWTDDIISSLTLASHGMVGDKQGIYHGVDLLGRKIVALNLFDGQDAKNILLTASSGSGKSGYAKMLATFIAVDNLFDVVVFDYEGNEYDAIVNTFDFLSVGFSSDDGSYINTIEIPDAVGDSEIDKQRIKDATEATEKVFDILFTDPKERTKGMGKQELAIFSVVLDATWAKVGVDKDNPDTYYKSKGLTYFHMYDTLNDMVNNFQQVSDKDILGGLEGIKDFQKVLMPFFTKVGARNHWFKTPISIQEVLDASNVRFSFGMGGKDENTESQLQLALQQMFASQLTQLKAKKNKAVGKKTVTFIEELQRYLKQTYSGDIVANLVSGGRKNGIINYLITNSPSDLLMRADIDSNVATIMSNINIQIIGALGANDMRALIDYFGLQNATGHLAMLTEVHQMSETQVGNSGSEHPLKYAFFLNKGGQSTLVKMVMHPELAKLPLYETIRTGKSLEELRRAPKMDKRDLDEEIKRSYEEDREAIEEEGLYGIKDNKLLPTKEFSRKNQGRK